MQPWKVTKSEIVSEDRWHRLRADHCLAEDGTIISPYYVLENAEWVCIFPVVENTQEVLLVREYRHGAKKICEGLPGGIVDDTDPSPEAAAKRELLEETGYNCRSMVPLQAVFANWSNHNNRVHCFLALDCYKVSDQNLDENELIEVFQATMPEVMEPGFFEQAYHVACLQMASLKLGSKIG